VQTVRELREGEGGATMKRKYEAKGEGSGGKREETDARRRVMG
jgi:hypothetical protein